LKKIIELGILKIETKVQVPGSPMVLGITCVPKGDTLNDQNLSALKILYLQTQKDSTMRIAVEWEDL